MTYKEIETDVWKPAEAEDEIEGVLVSKEPEVGVNKSYIYTLEVDKKAIAVWGSAVLDSKMLAVAVGSKIKIVYKGLGEAKQGHNAPKLFKVFVDSD